MNRWLLQFARVILVVFSGCTAAFAQERMSVRDLNRALAAGGAGGKTIAVNLRGVCTYPNTKGIHFYLHDGTSGVVVNVSNPAWCPAFGEEVEVTGVTGFYQGVFGIAAQSVTKIGAGKLPEPTRASPSAGGYPFFSQWLEVEGVVVQARANVSGALQLQLAGDGSWCTVTISKPGSLADIAWAGARARFRGVNANHPRLGLFCGDPSLIQVLAAGRPDVSGLPRTTVSSLGAASSAQLARIQGTVLAMRDSWIFTRDEDGAATKVQLLGGMPPDATWDRLLTAELSAPAVIPGQVVEAVGVPIRMGGKPSLHLARVRVLHTGLPPKPRLLTVAEALDGFAANDLITIRGRLRDYSSEELPSTASGGLWREGLRLEADGMVLEVVHEAEGSRGAFATFQRDDQIQATGILWPEAGVPPFRMHVAALRDVESLGLSPEVARQRQFRAVGVAAAAALLAAGWILLLRSKLKRERLLANERVRAEAAIRELNTTLEARVATRTTELQQAHEDLQRALSAERELGELKTRFVSLVSHEFRTPLGITMSAVELLRGYTERLDAMTRFELLEDIRQATLRMAGMMEQVLLLGRVDAGQRVCEAGAIDLAELGAAVAEEVRAATGSKCSIEFVAGNDLSGAVGDETLIRHILSNLVSNGVKYSAAGGTVEAHVSREGDRAVFRVSDRGIGIPIADQPRLFAAFYRAGNVGVTPGTGLGLLIAQRCVALHGGAIEFTSEEGKGTTFTVSLPLFEEAREAALATAS